MRRRATRFSIIVIGAAIAASLTFGARVAFAAPAMMDCPNDGWNTLGACTSYEDCRDACRAVHDMTADGRCRNGCCTCLF